MGNKISINTSKFRDINHTSFVFSGGEVFVKVQKRILDRDEFIIVSAFLYSSDAIMELVGVADAIKRTYPFTKVHAKIPYLPYARQDRSMNRGEALSLKAFTDILNSLDFESVEVWDVHSDVSLALVKNIIHVPVEEIISSSVIGNSILVSPDAGSLKKVSKIAHKFACQMVRADKTRSTEDGSITGTVVYSDPVGDKDFLIVDDICDGGRTFVELAKELRKLTLGKIHLYVTHGIFSKGFMELDAFISDIYCPCPFPHVDTSRIKVIDA